MQARQRWLSGRPDRWDGILAGVAVSGCLLMAAVVPRDPLANDGGDYAVMASNVLAGRGYTLDGVEPYAYRVPGYTLFVALIFAGFGPTPFPVVVVQVVMAALSPLLLRRLLRAAGLPPGPALAGAIAYATYLFPLVYVQQLLTEPLATFLVLLGALLGLQATSESLQVPSRAWLAGVLCTATALVKGNLICLTASFALFGFWVALRAGPLRWRAARGLSLFVLGALLVLAPWGVRNVLRFGEPHLLGKSTAGRALLMAQYETRDKWLPWTFWDQKNSGTLPAYREFRERDRRAEDLAAEEGIDAGTLKASLAWELIREDPFEALRGYTVRAYTLWLMIPTGRGTALKAAVLFVEGAALIIGTAGLWLYRQDLMLRGLPILGFILAEAVLLPLIHTEPRYSAPLKPFLISGVGFFAWHVMNRSSRVGPSGLSP